MVSEDKSINHFLGRETKPNSLEGLEHSVPVLHCGPYWKKNTYILMNPGLKFTVCQ